MADEAREIFERLGSRGYNPVLEGLHATYRFDVEGAGSWRVAIDDGNATVTEGPGEADCVVECSSEDLPLFASGEKNLLTALLQGRINITGDLALAQKFHGLVRAAANRPATAGRS